MKTTRSIPRKYRNVNASSSAHERLGLLGYLIRSGQATEEERATYATLENSNEQPARTIKAWYESPVAPSMWKGDARDLGCV